MGILNSFDGTGRRQALNVIFRYLPSNPSLLCSSKFTTAFLIPPKSSRSFNGCFINLSFFHLLLQRLAQTPCCYSPIFS